MKPKKNTNCKNEEQSTNKLSFLTWKNFSPYITYMIFGLISLYFFIFAPNFATIRNFLTISRITAVVSVMAIGSTFTIICSEIDLSVGSMASLSSMVAAVLLRAGYSIPTTIFLLALMAIGVGLINGILTTKLKIPSFLVTLGMLSVLRGVALTITNGMPVPIHSTTFTSMFASATFLGFPAPLIITLFFAIIGYYLLHLSVYGRRAYATGGNEVSARFSGVKTDKIKIIAFVLSSLTAVVGGLILAGRGSGGNPSLGGGLELDVIAAIIIGGTSLFGGKGSIIGSIIGSIFIGIVGFGLIVMGFRGSIQEIIKGGIIILAVSLNSKVIRQ